MALARETADVPSTPGISSGLPLHETDGHEKSFDGLQRMVREFLGQDPLSGHLSLFLNRRRDRVKILLWERDGLVIWYKRLEAGTFQQLDPATCSGLSSEEAGIELTTTELALLLAGVDLASAEGASAMHTPADLSAENSGKISRNPVSMLHLIRICNHD